jgi:N-acyl-D-aspartate/D-glutamate deacylase
MFDIVIKGGSVVDGTAGPARRADVGITGQTIACIDDSLEGRVELDASEAVVAPGFIDIHTHLDAQVFWDPALSPSCFHGVTTVIAGNCGFSIAPTRPEHREIVIETLHLVEDMSAAALRAGIDWCFESFPEYLAAVRRRGSLLNFGCYIGHSALRLYVMGEDFERAATDEEIEAMGELVAQALDAGAAGFSTSFGSHVGPGGRPVPSRFSDLREFEAISRVVARAGRGVVAILPLPQIPFEEVYELQRRTGAPMTLTGLVSFASGAHEAQVEAHRKGWAAGARVWPQITPAPLASDFSMAMPMRFNSNPTFAELASSPLEERRARYSEPAWRGRARRSFSTVEGFAPRPDLYMISASNAHPELIGRRVQDLADERRVDWLDLILDLGLEEPDLGLRILAPIANIEPDGVRRLLQEDHCTLGLSDAGAHLNQLCDADQTTTLLSRWVREEHALELPTAVRKLTGVQADLFGLQDRGYVREGYAADIVVFDPATVAPGPKRRLSDFPAGATRITADRPSGVRHVVVNGVPIRKDEEMVDLDPNQLPGRPPFPSLR